MDMNVSRRVFLQSTSAVAIAGGFPFRPLAAQVLLLKPRPAQTQAAAPPVAAPAYSQAMGATDSSGMVISFPFSASATNSSTIPRQFWCNATTGNDSYNGLSPYPGYQMNGLGTNFQFGATGQGKANAAYGPKKTFFAAYEQIAGNASNRVGNQIFLAQGQTFYEGASTDSFNYRSGFSSQYPFCIQSYDPTDPLNLAKQGRATGGNRPTLSTTVTNGVGRNYGVITFYATDNPKPSGTSSIPRGNFAIRGINFASGTSDSCQVTWVGNPSNVLFENCTFPGTGLGIGSSNVAANANNIIFRRCAISGDYSSAAAHSAGIGTGHTDGLVIEDCIVYHTGWPISSDRQQASFTGTLKGNTLTITGPLSGAGIAVGQTLSGIGIGSATITAGSGSSWTFSGAAQNVVARTMITTVPAGPDIFKQGLYLSYGANDQSICRRCVIIDNSASGLSGRGSLLAYHNILIDNPVQMVAGGSVNSGTGGYSTESPTGVDFNYHHNFIMGSADINMANIRGQGISTQNGRRGSGCKYNLFVNNPDYTAGVAFIFQSNAAYNQPSYCDYTGNCAYAFFPTLENAAMNTKTFPAQLLTTYNASTVSPNSNVVSATSPHTNAEIYSTLGFPSKAALASAMIAAPERNWAYLILQAAGTMFSFNFALGG
jgi:hypothetical protein